MPPKVGPTRKLAKKSDIETLCYQVRKKLDMSQAEFAEHLRNQTGWRGPAEYTVFRWEQGIKPASHFQTLLERLARENGVRVPRLKTG